MIKLVALKRLTYPRGGVGGKEYQPGEQFDALSERDAYALKVMKAAKAAEVRAAEPTPTMRTAALQAEPEADPPVEKPTRGRYRRSDLQADD